MSSYRTMVDNLCKGRLVDELHCYDCKLFNSSVCDGDNVHGNYPKSEKLFDAEMRTAIEDEELMFELLHYNGNVI